LWYLTRGLNLLSMTMDHQECYDVSLNKCVKKTIMSLKPNQLQLTTANAQTYAIFEELHKVVAPQCYAQIN
jgi:hypothetical protein